MSLSNSAPSLPELISKKNETMFTLKKSNIAEFLLPADFPLLILSMISKN